jgi:uncharacterized protein YutE (UPF0331/DUF86 family)
MKGKSTELEYRRLLRVAKEYKKKGYEIIIYPKCGDLPDFLKQFEPDMIARKGKDLAVIEVKSQETLKGQPRLTRLASQVEKHPRWRFELIITNPRKKLKINFAAKLISFKEIEERIRIANEMWASKQRATALLVAGTAVEARMRIVLKDLGKDVQNLPTTAVIKTLYSLGFISHTHYDFLEKYFKLKNQIVHGFEPLKLDPKLIANLELVLRQI